MQSSRNVILLPNACSSWGVICFKDNLLSIFPFGLPRWDNITIFEFNNLSSAIESMTRIILSLTGDPLASGTFKSNLINTVLFSVLNFLIF